MEHGNHGRGHRRAGDYGAVGVTADLKQIRAAVAAHVPNSELRTALLTLIDEADGDIMRARKNVEEWYEAMMDRVSGWYKRRTTVIMLVLGFVVAGAINADTISLRSYARARRRASRSSCRGSGAVSDTAAGNNVTCDDAAHDDAIHDHATTTMLPTTMPPATEQPQLPALEAQLHRKRRPTSGTRLRRGAKDAYAAVDELGLPLGSVNAPKESR